MIGVGQQTESDPSKNHERGPEIHVGSNDCLLFPTSKKIRGSNIQQGQISW